MKYYVYMLCDPLHNDRPFYVDKGCRNRAKDHLLKNERKNKRKHDEISKIRAAGFEPTIKYHTVNLLENDAYELESQLIMHYGRYDRDEGGILTNICTTQRPSRIWDADAKRAFADSQLGEKNHRYGKTWSDGAKQRRSQWAKDAGIKPPIRSGPMSEEQKAAIGAGNTGKKRTPEQSAYLSSIRAGKKSKPCSLETRQKIRLANISKSGKPIQPQDLSRLSFGLWTVINRVADRRDEGQKGADAEFWLCCRSSNPEIIREVSRKNLLRAKKA
jgi:hypothetical protein